MRSDAIRRRPLRGWRGAWRRKSRCGGARREATGGSRCARRISRRARGKCKGPDRRRDCESRKTARTNDDSTPVGIGAPSRQHAQFRVRVIGGPQRHLDRPGTRAGMAPRVVEQVDHDTAQMLGVEHHPQRLARQVDAKNAGSPSCTPAACAHSLHTEAQLGRGVDAADLLHLTGRHFHHVVDDAFQALDVLRHHARQLALRRIGGRLRQAARWPGRSPPSGLRISCAMPQRPGPWPPAFRCRLRACTFAQVLEKHRRTRPRSPVARASW